MSRQHHAPAPSTSPLKRGRHNVWKERPNRSNSRDKESRAARSHREAHEAPRGDQRETAGADAEGHGEGNRLAERVVLFRRPREGGDPGNETKAAHGAAFVFENKINNNECMVLFSFSSPHQPPIRIGQPPIGASGNHRREFVTNTPLH